MSRTAVLVLGMHRSGTSALTWLLGRLGAALPGDAIAPSGDNARGYWESQALVKADDQLLRVARSSWFDPRPLDLSRLSADGLRSRKERMREAIEHAWGDAPLLAIKDPRQCRFVPVIADVLRDMVVEPRAVLMLRRPAEIAHSLHARDGTTPAFAHLLWLRHMIDAERDTRGLKRAVVDFDDMLADGRATTSRLAQLLGRDDWQPEAADTAAIDAFLDPGLHHHAAASSDLEPPLAEIVCAVDEALRMLIGRDDAAARERLDAAYGELDRRPWLRDDIIHDELRHRRIKVDDAETPVVPDEKPASSDGGIDADRSDPSPAQAERSGGSSDAELIRNSGLFDTDYYRARYPEVAAGGLDPIDHYLTVGAAQGYNPSALFDTGYYARQLARRREAGDGR